MPAELAEGESQGFSSDQTSSIAGDPPPRPRAHERSLARARAKRKAQRRIERRRRRVTVGLVWLVLLLLIAALIVSVLPRQGMSPTVEDSAAASSPAPPHS